jgi:sugar lactone lactonase YvrE
MRPGTASTHDSARFPHGLPAAPRRRLGRSLFLIASCAVALSCASSWSLRTSQPEVALQWPYPPARPALTYLRSIHGLSRSADAGSLAQAFVYGRAPSDSGGFQVPVAVAVGEDGRIAVADTGCACVHLFIPARSQYLRLLGAKESPLGSPVGVVFGDGARLYVADSTGQVLAFGADGSLELTLRQAGATPLRRPTGVAYSPKRRLLYVVDTLGHAMHGLHPNGELAWSRAQRGEVEGAFNFPTHITWSAPDELVVTDALNFRLQIFSDLGEFRAALGRHGDGSGDLAMPKGVAVDAGGVLYVADSVFDNVQLFDRSGGFLLTLGRRGTDFGEFWLPAGLAISAAGELYVCDTYNRRIQVFRISERSHAKP